jgi:hypothetical protein
MSFDSELRRETAREAGTACQRDLGYAKDGQPRKASRVDVMIRWVRVRPQGAVLDLCEPLVGVQPCHEGARRVAVNLGRSQQDRTNLAIRIQQHTA